jgi:hypothetical protein
MDKINPLEIVFPRRTSGYFDDFDHLEANRFTATVTGTGAATIDADDPDGAVTITSGATQNSDVVFAETNANAYLANGKPCEWEARFKHTEGNTDDGAVAFGCTSQAAALTDLFVDSTGAFHANSFSGAMIVKPVNSTRWVMISSIGTTQVSTTLDVTHVSGQMMNWGLLVQPLSATEVQFIPYCDPTGVGALKPVMEYSANRAARTTQVVHRRTWSSGIAMRGLFSVKNPLGGVAEVCSLDYFARRKRRS